MADMNVLVREISGHRGLACSPLTNEILARVARTRFEESRSVLELCWTLHASRTTMANRPIGVDFNDQDATVTAFFLRTNSSVTRLSLWENHIGPTGAAALGEALKFNSTLTELNLWKNHIGDVGAAAFGEALKANSTLVTLDLWRNRIGDVGAMAIGEALKTNSKLKTLYLGWKASGERGKIGDAGAIALSEALRANSSLTNLDLGNNEVGDAGAAALGEALKDNSTLTTLGLWSNKVGDAGAVALGEALTVNSTLRTLELEDNGIGAAGTVALGAARVVHSTPTDLDLDVPGSQCSLATSGKLGVGARVDGRFLKGPVWYPGVISNVNPNGTYDVDYDDGDKEREMKPDMVRPIGHVDRRHGSGARRQWIDKARQQHTDTHAALVCGCTREQLLAMGADDRREVLGSVLYPLIKEHVPESRAETVTGMLLDLELMMVIGAIVNETDRRNIAEEAIRFLDAESIEPYIHRPNRLRNSPGGADRRREADGNANAGSVAGLVSQLESSAATRTAAAAGAAHSGSVAARVSSAERMTSRRATAVSGRRGSQRATKPRGAAAAAAGVARRRCSSAAGRHREADGNANAGSVAGLVSQLESSAATRTAAAAGAAHSGSIAARVSSAGRMASRRATAVSGRRGSQRATKPRGAAAAAAGVARRRCSSAAGRHREADGNANAGSSTRGTGRVEAAWRGMASWATSERAASADCSTSQKAAGGRASTALSSECVICMDAQRGAIPVPCGHVCACYDCLQTIHSQGEGCPVCRQSIERVVRIYAC